MSIALSTVGFWHFASLNDTLTKLARLGVEAFEFFPYPPHLDPASFGRYERAVLRRQTRDLGIRCSSVGYSVEFNLLSLHNGLHEYAMSEYRRAIEIAADIDAPYFVLPVGRRHGILPAPIEPTLDFLCEEVYALADHAKMAGINIALETLPWDLLTTGSEINEMVERIGHSHIGICYDCANTLAHEDPAQGVKQVADKLVLVHVSDAWRDRWAHTAIGRGEVEFGAFGGALNEIGYRGDVVYELLDGEDPEPRIADGLRLLQAAGFAG